MYIELGLLSQGHVYVTKWSYQLRLYNHLKYNFHLNNIVLLQK